MFHSTFSFWRRLVGMTPAATTDSAVATEERRLWVRYPTNLVTIVHTAAGDEPSERVSAVVRDISLGGVNLVVDRPFETGQLISVELPLEGEETQTVLACVVRANPQHGQQWALGCVFSRELASEDLEGLGARRLRNKPDDKRVWMRFPTNVEATYQKVGAFDSESLPARVLNVSASGVGLLVSERVETGALLSVDLLGHGKTRRTILACVVHVSPRDDAWALGCNFIRALSEQDLQAFL